MIWEDSRMLEAGGNDGWHEETLDDEPPNYRKLKPPLRLPLLYTNIQSETL